MKLGKKRILFAVTALYAAGFVASAADWPQSMGPDGSGFTSEKIEPAAIAGANGPQLLWRAPTGIGGAPPIVVNGKVYVIGGFTPGKEPGPDSTPDRIASHWDKEHTPLDVWVSCLKGGDGTVLWRRCVSEGEILSRQAGIYASPLYHEGKIFVRTTKYAAALDSNSGKTVWTLDLEKALNASTPYSGFFKTKIPEGPFMIGRGAPITAGGKLLLSYFEGSIGSYGGDNTYVEAYATCAAFDPASGKLLWKYRSSKYTRSYDPEKSDSETGYNSWEPALAAGTIDGKPTVVMSTGHAVIGLDLAAGGRLWVFHHAKELDSIRKFVNDNDATTKPNPWPWWIGYGYVPPQVLISGNIVIDRIFCGHGTLGTSTYAIEIRDGHPKLLWQTDQLSARNAKYVLHDGKLYGIDLYSHLHTFKESKIVEWPRPHRPEEIKQFQCRDIRTGNLIWSSDELYQAEKQPPKSFACEDKERSSNNFLSPCPALTDWLRTKPDEGGYSYPGDPAFILCGDMLVFKAARQTASGLYFARLTGNGMQKLGGRSFSLGDYFLGEPVVAEGKCFIKLDNEKNDFDGKRTGNLLCFDIGKP